MVRFRTIMIPVRCKSTELERSPAMARAILDRWTEKAIERRVVDDPKTQHRVQLLFMDGERMTADVCSLKQKAANYDSSLGTPAEAALVSRFSDEELRTLGAAQKAGRERRLVRNRQARYAMGSLRSAQKPPPTMYPNQQAAIEALSEPFVQRVGGKTRIMEDVRRRVEAGDIVMSDPTLDRLHRQGQRPHIVEVIDTGDTDALDQKILDTLASKGAVSRGEDGRRSCAADRALGCEPRAERAGEGDGAREVCAGQARPGREQTRFVGSAQAHSEVGKAAGRSDVMGTLAIAVVKQKSGGHMVEIGPGGGSEWSYAQRSDGTSGTTAYLTAPEIDRLIAQLGKARDAARAANRPVNGFGTYR